MDLELNSEQTLLVEAVESLGARWRELPRGHERDSAYFASDLHRDLTERRADIEQYANERYSWSTVGEMTELVYRSLAGRAAR